MVFWISAILNRTVRMLVSIRSTGSTKRAGIIEQREKLRALAGICEFHLSYF